MLQEPFTTLSRRIAMIRKTILGKLNEKVVRAKLQSYGETFLARVKEEFPELKHALDNGLVTLEFVLTISKKTAKPIIITDDFDSGDHGDQEMLNSALKTFRGIEMQEKEVPDPVSKPTKETRPEKETSVPSDREALLGKPVSALNLKVRAQRGMDRLRISTLGELVQKTAKELLKARNFGMLSLYEVQGKLQELGLYLKGEGPYEEGM